MALSSIDLWLPALDGWVGRWRRDTVAGAHRGVAPHVSLLYPWAPAPPTQDQFSRLARALEGTPAFDLTFPRLGRFPGVLWLTPEPDGPVRALMRRVAQAFPEYPAYSGKFAEPQPHLTVAKGKDAMLDEIERELARSLDALARQRFRVDAVVVAEEDASGQWSVTWEFALG